MANGDDNFTNITLKDSLKILCDRPQLTERVFKSDYCFWVGSGISRCRYPGLPELISKLLNELWARVDHDNSETCPFNCTLLRIVKTGCGEINEIPAQQPEWGKLVEHAIPRLLEYYQDILSETVNHQGEVISVAFDILNLIDLYSNLEVPVDAEHEFIALLAAEGFVKEVVTTNWDPLLEKASEKIFWDCCYFKNSWVCGTCLSGSRKL